MTGTDLIVVAPWIIFAAGLSIVCIRLLRARRASGRHAAKPPPRPSHPQEARCPNKNA
jgi:hypothetical protein